MKNSLTVVAALALVFAAAGPARGQATMTATMSAKIVSPTAFVTRKATTSSKLVTTSITTATLLNWLMQDEGANWPFTDAKSGNPTIKGVKLAASFGGVGPGGFGTISFIAVSEVTNTFTLDVLTAMSASVADVGSGSYSTNAGPNAEPFSTNDVQDYTITYDSTPDGGHRSFIITGTSYSTVTVGPNNAKGISKETDSWSFTGTSGGGVDNNGNPIVITSCSFIASGVTTQDCGCGSQEEDARPKSAAPVH